MNEEKSSSTGQQDLDLELTHLEEKINGVVSLCERLREENNQLRARLLLLESDQDTLTKTLGAAKSRVEMLLSKLSDA